ncbi:Carrier protein, mitochondrial [Blastocladiella emersonii ATCC 22665]|nr:Carrier protein, mitochondrial [Blastocladiella emersonii ATCC 22665]
MNSSSPPQARHRPEPAPMERSDRDAGPLLAEATLHRLASASAGSILTSLLVTPLDVVKTRMQQQPAPGSPAAGAPGTGAAPRPAAPKPRCPIPGPGRLPHAAAAGGVAGPAPIMTCCREVFFSGGKEVAWFCTSRHGFVERPHTAPRLSPAAATSATAAHPRVSTAPRSGGAARVHAAAGAARTVSLPPPPAQSTAMPAGQFTGTWDAMVRIARAEGISSLWRGLTPTLIMAVPANVIYFVGYEWLKDSIAPAVPRPDIYAPLLAGGLARTIAVTVISPIELVRTQMQSVYAADKAVGDILAQVASHVRRVGPHYLWRGLSATLARDVPFSALYWASYEALKAQWTPYAPAHDEWVVPFAAGATAGMVAAAATTPLDVAKTRRQLSTAGTPARLYLILRSIGKREGVSGLFAGLVPRVAKVAPACAIMIGTYEYGKAAFERPRGE